jgi:predicted nucleic acid-binding Zn ribbon protein
MLGHLKGYAAVERATDYQRPPQVMQKNQDVRRAEPNPNLAAITSSRVNAPARGFVEV